MYSLFIPEDKAGTIICQRAAEIVHEPLKRKRIATMREIISLLKVMRLSPSAPDYVTSISYGCDAAGIVGLIVLIGTGETVATSKGP